MWSSWFGGGGGADDGGGASGDGASSSGGVLRYLATLVEGPASAASPAGPAAALPWERPDVPEARRAELEASLRSLSRSRRTYMEPPPRDANWTFSLDEWAPTATRLLEVGQRGLPCALPVSSLHLGYAWPLSFSLSLVGAHGIAGAVDKELARFRWDLVPGKLCEEHFWRNYFYRVSLCVAAVAEVRPLAASGASPAPDELDSPGPRSRPAALPQPVPLPSLNRSASDAIVVDADFVSAELGGQ